jgi:hypothetical protein
MERSSGSVWARVRASLVSSLTVYVLALLMDAPSALGAANAELAPVNEPTVANGILPESSLAVPSGVAVGRTRGTFAVSSGGTPDLHNRPQQPDPLLDL